MEQIEPAPIGPTVGARISGIDLSRPLSDNVASMIDDAFAQHKVLVFPEQKLTPDSFEAFARRFGPLGQYPMVRGMESHPHIVEVIKEADEKVNFGGVWHTDTSYLEEPPTASFLLARELPPVGGDTLFADMVAAYEALSPAMRDMLDGMTAINRSDKDVAAKTRTHRIADTGNKDAKPVYVATHPVIRTHPVTGKKSLYVHPGHTDRINELTEAESKAVLEFLFQHQILSEFQIRIRWEPDMMVMWDNRSVLHNAMNDYHGHRRHMWRITLAGEKAV